MLRTDTDMRQLENYLRNPEAFYQEVSGFRRQGLSRRGVQQGPPSDVVGMLARELNDADRLSIFRRALQKPSQLYLGVFNKRPGASTMANRVRGPMIRIQRGQSSQRGDDTNTGELMLYSSRRRVLTVHKLKIEHLE